MTEGVDVRNETQVETRGVKKKETPQGPENRPVLILNPGHGNEPFILGTAIGREVSKKFAQAGLEQPILVQPLLYGERQIRILLEENPNDASQIYYDEEYGKLLQRIIFGSGDFPTHLKQVKNHYDEVDKMLQQRFGVESGSFTARSLATNEEFLISPKNIIGTIDAGSRVTVRTPHRYFAFPMLLSELLNRAIEHPELGFSETDMRQVAARMLKVEAAYSQVFVPWVNPFSFEHADNLEDQPEVVGGRSRIYTPPMKSEIPKTSGVLKNKGVYVMFSGTNSAVEANKILVEALRKAGIDVYSPLEHVEGAIKMPPEIMSDENIIAILGRSGWGTIWQGEQLEIPWFAAPYQEGDDPEIYFNNLTIEALGLGKIINGGITAEELTRLASDLSPGLRGLNRQINRKFGTNDGIDFISKEIFRDLIRK